MRNYGEAERRGYIGTHAELSEGRHQQQCCKMFTSAPKWNFQRPVAEGPGSFSQASRKFSVELFGPFGIRLEEVITNRSPVRVKTDSTANLSNFHKEEADEHNNGSASRYVSGLHASLLRVSTSHPLPLESERFCRRDGVGDRFHRSYLLHRYRRCRVEKAVYNLPLVVRDGRPRSAGLSG